MYKNSLDEYVVPVLQNSGFENPVFMQDNAPCNKANQLIAYLNDQGINVMDWPAQSSDITPRENLWKTLGQNVLSLDEYVVPVLQNSGFENPVFMQDNAPCNKANQLIAYLNDSLRL